jgi:hypothetical protein
MKKRKSRDPRTDIVYASFTSAGAVMMQDPLALGIARDLEERGFHIDVEEIEATLAKLRPAQRDETAAFIKKSVRKREALRQAAIAQLVPPAVQRKRLAAVIKHEHAALAAKLRRRGVPKPITQAWEELAKRYGHTSGYALKKWVRRNR